MTDAFAHIHIHNSFTHAQHFSRRDMSESKDDAAECVVRKLVTSVSVTLTCNTEFTDVFKNDSPKSRLLRNSLFGLSPSGQVSYDEAFSRVLYEAARLNGTKALAQFVGHGASLLEDAFGLTAGAASDILAQFDQKKDLQHKRFYWFRGAAMLCLRVLVNHTIGDRGLALTSAIEYGFVEEICRDDSQRAFNTLPADMLLSYTDSSTPRAPVASIRQQLHIGHMHSKN